MIKLYHIEKYIPQWAIDDALNLQKNINTYILSRHLKEHIYNQNDKHTISKHRLYEILNELKYNPIIPFEIEISNDIIPNQWVVSKIVIRTMYDEMLDISIALRNKLVVTAWLNSNEDKHYTLDLDKYEG